MQEHSWIRAAICTWEFQDPRIGDQPFVIVGHQRAIGGIGQGLGMVQVDTECQGNVRCRLLGMWLCGKGEDWGTLKNGQGLIMSTNIHGNYQYLTIFYYNYQ